MILNKEHVLGKLQYLLVDPRDKRERPQCLNCL